MDSGLGEAGELLEIGGVRDILQTARNAAAVIGPAGPDELAFGVQHLRQFRIAKGEFHRWG